VRHRRRPTQLGPLAVVGAWLKLWTPPRDAVVPPVPWRRLALGGLAAAAVVGVAAALIVPAIDRSKQSGAERQRAAAARRAAAERARIAAVQRPRHARTAPRRGRGGRTLAAERRARRALLAAAAASITADARRRARTAELAGPILRTSCTPTPASIRRAGAETTLRGSSDAYDCSPSRATSRACRATLRGRSATRSGRSSTSTPAATSGAG
jgi:hypothetical protein